MRRAHIRTPTRHRVPDQEPGRILIPGDGAAGDQGLRMGRPGNGGYATPAACPVSTTSWRYGLRRTRGLAAGRSHRPRSAWSNQARLALLVVTHRYKRAPGLWLEQFQIAEYAAFSTGSAGTGSGVQNHLFCMRRGRFERGPGLNPYAVIARVCMSTGMHRHGLGGRSDWADRLASTWAESAVIAVLDCGKGGNLRETRGEDGLARYFGRGMRHAAWLRHAQFNFYDNPTGSGSGGTRSTPYLESPVPLPGHAFISYVREAARRGRCAAEEARSGWGPSMAR